jgi:phage terminase large subunit-like protein
MRGEREGRREEKGGGEMREGMREEMRGRGRRRGWEGYAEGVLEGRITAGELMRAAAGRFMRMLGDERYEFRAEKVEKVIEFTGQLKHFKAPDTGKAFVLEPWQEFIVAGIYGFYVRSTGKRLVTGVYIEMARKNGKTAFAAALCLYHLLIDGVTGGEIYLAANSREQVKETAWPLCSEFARGLDRKGKVLKLFRDTIKCPLTKSHIKVLQAEAKRLDGLNPSLWVLDEYHASPGSDLKGVLETGQGNRENPLGIIITSAGFDRLGPCYVYRTMCCEVLSGVQEKDDLFAAIFSLDEGDDYGDEKVWEKANPNMGVTVSKEFLVKAAKEAGTSAADEVQRKTKNFNIWCTSGRVWIPDNYILKCCRDIDPGDYKYCFMGVDLGATSDLTAVSGLFPGADGKLYFKTWYYLPREAMVTEQFRRQYEEWERAGALTLTPGNVTNYDYILDDMMRLREVCPVVLVGYDKWNATQFVANAQSEGFKMQEYSQTASNFNRPTKEMERLILSGEMYIDNNVINRHCFRNVELYTDHAGNVKPTKKNPMKKIDGVIAKLNALGVYLVTPKYTNEI